MLFQINFKLNKLNRRHWFYRSNRFNLINKYYRLRKFSRTPLNSFNRLKEFALLKGFKGHNKWRQRFSRYSQDPKYLKPIPGR